MATTEIHFKTCFCEDCQDLGPAFFKIFFLAHPTRNGNLTLTLSTKSLCVYPISLLGDLCNVDYLVQIAVLTTKYKYVQHKYAK